jgi:hypothetical protein
VTSTLISGGGDYGLIVLHRPRCETASRSVHSEPVDQVQTEEVDEGIGELAGHRAQDGPGALMNGHFAHVHKLLREPECDFLAVRVLYTCRETVLIADRKTDRAHRGADGRIVESDSAREHPLRPELVLRAGGQMERVLEVQVLAQALGIG